MTGTGAGVGLAGGLQRHRFSLLVGLLQLAFIVLFSLTATYGPRDEARGLDGFQDAHLGIVLGLGLLLAFLKRYAASALGFHLLLLALVLQWAIFVQQIFFTRGTHVILSINNLLMGDFAALAVLVTLGAVAGKLTAIQLIVLALFEVVFMVVNHYIGSLLFQASDSGRAMYTHVFGAFFGLAVSRLTHQQHHIDHPQESSTYASDALTILGTLVLWVCFPGLNAALAPGQSGELAVVNTVLALGAATVATFALSMFCHPEERFSITHLQSAVLAGGVASGTTAHLVLKPYGALLLGAVAAGVAVLGLTYAQPALRRFRISDTRGVFSVHGLPGVLGALASILVAGFAHYDNYGVELFHSFPAMVAVNESVNTIAEVGQLVETGGLEWGSGRSAWGQALFQFLTLAITLGISVVSGIITGFLLTLRCFRQLSAEEVFDDTAFFDICKEGLPAFTVYVPPPAPEPAEEEAVELKPAAEAEAEEQPNGQPDKE